MVHEEQLKVCQEKWKNVDIHIRESPDFRDRILKLEMRIDLIEKQVLRNAIVGGIIGALIGSGAAPAVKSLIGFLLKVM